MVTAADTEDSAPLGQDVGDGVILSEPQWMPHRRDVKAAAYFEVPGEMAKMHGHHEKIRNHLIAFRLEVMLGHTKRIPAGLVH